MDQAQREQFETDARMFGIPVDELIKRSGMRDDGSNADFPIWQDNLPTLDVFLSCAYKWNVLVVGPISRRTDLRWQDVKTAIWAANLKNAREVFNDIRAMELAAIEVFNAAK